MPMLWHMCFDQSRSMVGHHRTIAYVMIPEPMAITTGSFCECFCEFLSGYTMKKAGARSEMRERSMQNHPTSRAGFGACFVTIENIGNICLCTLLLHSMSGFATHRFEGPSPRDWSIRISHEPTALKSQSKFSGTEEQPKERAFWASIRYPGGRPGSKSSFLPPSLGTQGNTV